MNCGPMTEPAASKLSLVALVPLLVFAALFALFFFRLGSGDNSRIPSALIGRPVPEFDLPQLRPDGGAASARVTKSELTRGGVTVLNVFASWCAPCHAEHDVLMRLAQESKAPGAGFTLIGLAYKDEPENALRFLGAKGNPYRVIAADRTGRTAIDWGVYGIPETFIVRADGVIAYKFVGPMSDEAMTDVILPEIKKAAAAPLKLTRAVP